LKSVTPQVHAEVKTYARSRGAGVRRKSFAIPDEARQRRLASAPPLRGARDYLAGQLPVPNCSHDKSALSAYR
jgi:hypothetical protein